MPLSSLLLQFGYLQLLDVLTTLAFLANGGREANPLVVSMLRFAPTPLVALLVVKSIAVTLAVACVMAKRQSVLLRINVFFAALIAWNLVALTIRPLV